MDEECFKGGFDCNEFGVEITEHSCSSFTFTANDDKAYMKVDGELIANSKKGYDFDTQKPGKYIVEIGYEGEGCPNGTSRTFVIHVDEDCFR